jgi:hypothetical protein
VSLTARLTRLRRLALNRPRPGNRTLELIGRDRANLFRLSGLSPDPWQEQQLRRTAGGVLLLCSRQSGKSTTAAAVALTEALLTAKATVLLLSPSIRQSGELFRKVSELYFELRRPIPAVRETALQLELANGSRVVSLPGTEGTVRGFSKVSLLIIDEAARVSDALYYAVRPMLAVSAGRLVALSTPFGQRGWFHSEWTGSGDWERVMVTADQVPRISPGFLAEERRALGNRWFAQEYMCSFESTVDAVFDYRDIQAALSDDVKPLFAAGVPK